MGDKKGPIHEYVKYVGLGFEILVSILLFSGIGYFLDKRMATDKPWFLLGFSLLGCVVAIYLMIRKIK